MDFISINRNLEKEIRSSKSFLFAHFAPISNAKNAFEVTGKAVDPYLLGAELELYENITQYPTIDVVKETVESVDFIIDNLVDLQKRESIQVLLETKPDLAEVVGGLSAVICLSQLIQNDIRFNVLKAYSEDGDRLPVIQVPSYLSNSISDFEAVMMNRTSIVNEDKYLAYMFVEVQIQAVVKEVVNRDFEITTPQSNWFARITRHYTQGHYDVKRAVDEARNHPLVFCLLVAPILGIAWDSIEPLSTSNKYSRLSYESKKEIIETLKPLIEIISYEFALDEFTAM